MNSDPRNIHSHAHAMLVEQVMAIHGRGSSDPKTYRRVLERMSSAALQRAIDESDFPVSAEAPQCAEANPRVPNGDVPETREDQANRSELPTRELTFEVVTMQWHCIDCHGNFQGPTNCSPKNGCPHCGSHQIFDVNLSPLGANKAELS